MGARLERLGRTRARLRGRLKFDGVSVSLLYEDGSSLRGATRGNGLIATTSRPTCAPSGRCRSACAASCAAACSCARVYLPRSVFRRLNREREEAGLPLFVNPRTRPRHHPAARQPRVAARQTRGAGLPRRRGPRLGSTPRARAPRRVGLPGPRQLAQVPRPGAVEAFVGTAGAPARARLRDDGVVVSRSTSCAARAAGSTAKCRAGQWRSSTSPSAARPWCARSSSRWDARLLTRSPCSSRCSWRHHGRRATLHNYEDHGAQGRCASATRCASSAAAT